MRRLLLFVALFSVTLIACGSGNGTGGGASTGPVSITVWHFETASSEDNFKKLVDEFNSSQEDVKVTPIYQGNDVELVLKLISGMRSGNVPSITYLSEPYAGTMIDSRQIVPMQQFVDRDHYDLSGLDPAALAYYTVGGELQSMPYVLTVPLMFYNKIPFREVGLDPDKPPRDLNEARDVAQKLLVKDAAGNIVRTGFALDISAYNLEFQIAGANQPYVNNNNGRTARATEVAFDNPAGRAVFSWWHDVVQDGLAINVGRNPTGAANLLALASQKAVMAFSISSALRSVYDVLEQTKMEGIEMGVAPVPGVPGGVAEGSPGVYSRALWIMSGRPKAEQEASWKFIQWLMQSDRQAEWFAGSGYLPVRTDAYDQPAAKEVVAKYPAFQVAVDMFRKTPTGYNALGPLLGPFQEVRDGVSDAIESMVSGNTSADDAMKAAVEHGNAAIRDYNDKLGQ